METDWGTGLYACTHNGVGECLDICFCCLCELSRQANSTAGFSRSYNVPALCVAPCCFPVLYFFLRRRVVDKYHINEDPCLTLATISCCGLCSTCQMHRELDLHNVPCGHTLPCVSDDEAATLLNMHVMR